MLLCGCFHIIAVQGLGIGKSLDGYDCFSSNGIVNSIIVIVFKQVISWEHSLTRFIV